MSVSPHVVVIGGGLSGLTAAFYLRKHLPGARVTVLEAQDRIGGVIQTESIGGYLVEHGADMFAVVPPDAMQLCEDLGIRQRLIPLHSDDPGAMVVHRERLVPVPEGFVLMRPTRLRPMLSTPLLSPVGKLRMLAEPLAPTRRCTEDESVASFVRRRLGGEVLQRIVQPLVGGIYTADAERLSMQATMPQFVKMEQEFGSLWAASRARRRSGEDAPERTSSGARYGQFRSFPQGMSELFGALRQSLPSGTIRTVAPVRGLQLTAGQSPSPQAAAERAGSDPCWQVSWGGDDQPSLQADGVLMALPAGAAALLLRDLARGAADALASIPYASSAIVVLGVRERDIARPVRSFGFVVPASENRRILACSFASHKLPGRVPEDAAAGPQDARQQDQRRQLIRVFIGGAMQPELLQRDDRALIEIARRELADLIGLSGTPELQRVVRWPSAMPQYHVGHLRLVDQIRQNTDRLPRFEIAGNALHGVGIAPVIRSARQAAERLADAVGGTRREARK